MAGHLFPEYQSDHDEFYTPEWATEALLKAYQFNDVVWEPAPGEGHIVSVLRNVGGYRVVTTRGDFLSYACAPRGARAVITNPPYNDGMTDRFVQHALRLMKPVDGQVAMLMSHAWECAPSRRFLLKRHRAYTRGYTITKRIRWANLDQKVAGPRTHHAWYVWDWANDKPPQPDWLP